jgi:hypothetical protein
MTSEVPTAKVRRPSFNGDAMYAIRMRFRFARLSPAVLACIVAACSLISPFNERAYEIATAAKVDALAVVSMGTEPFSSHAADVQALKLEIDKAYEYAKGRPHNDEATQQWAIIRDPTRNSLGGFLRRWQERGTLDAAFVDEAQGLIADGFDAVIELESGKRKQSE